MKFSNWRRINVSLIGLSLVLFIVWFATQQVSDLQLAEIYLTWGLDPARFRGGSFWQILTHAALHGPVWHLLLNVAGMVLLGHRVAAYVGNRRMLVLLTLGILGGAVFHLVSQLWAHQEILLIGISAGVYAFISFIISLSPGAKMRWIGLRARNLLAGVTLATIALIIVNQFSPPAGNTIAHEAHLGGLVAGFVYAKWFLRPGPSLANLQEARRRREASLER